MTVSNFTVANCSVGYVDCFKAVASHKCTGNTCSVEQSEIGELLKLLIKKVIVVTV